MDLQALRGEIDKVDKEIVGLFLRRMALAEQVAAAKRKSHGAVLQPGREAQVIARARELAGPAMADYTQQLFETLMRLSRERQQALGAGSPHS